MDLNLAKYIEDLRRMRSNAIDALTDVESYQGRAYGEDATEDFSAEIEDASEKIRQYARSLYNGLLASLELINLPETRTQLINDFQKFINTPSDADPTYHEETETFFSPALVALGPYLSMLESLVAPSEPALDMAQAAKREILERILSATPKLVRDHEIDPSKEPEVYKTVEPILAVVFPDLRRQIKLPKPIKNYVPEFGVPELRALIEYKYADSEQKVKDSIDGIFADMQGYAGSRDWEAYYAVIYMTESFFTQDQLHAHVKSGDLGPDWRFIFVLGSGTKKTTRKPQSQATGGSPS